MPHLSLFATPVSMYDLADMEQVNREVTERLVAESVATPTIHRSNVGGWHSQVDLAMRPEACFRKVIEQIVARVRETVEHLAQEAKKPVPPMRIGVGAWAMVMRKGDYTMPHHHSDVQWATVYYPDAGDADETEFPHSGLLSLLDPRVAGRPMPIDLSGTVYVARPRTGRLVVFPGWLLHYVNTYYGNRPRVAISCNVVFEPMAAPQPPAGVRQQQRVTT